MKTIFFNTDSLIMGGAEKLALQYVKELSKDYKVVLLINENNGGGNVLEKEIPKNVEYKYIVNKYIIDNLNKYRNLKKKNKINIWYRIKYNYFLKKRRESFKKNIIEYIKSNDYDILIDFYCKLPLEIIDDRVISWLHLSLDGIKEKQKKIYSEKFEKVKNIVVINDDMKKEFAKYFPKNLNKVKRIYNLFDIKEIINKAIDIDSLTKKEKEIIKEKYILACCRLDRQKDLETLISAFSNLKREKNILEKLYIIGNGDRKEKLVKLVKKLKISNEVLFLGTQKNPYIWMKNAELFVHSSHKEGFGMVIVEAMITNGLVLSSDCPVGPREILESGKSGVLVEPKNILEMEEKIIELLSNKKLREEKKRNALTRIEDFSLENNYKKIIEMIEN